jgi:hypothetical protein
MLSSRATWGNSSVSSMAYQAPLLPRACLKAWAHHLWVQKGIQPSASGGPVRAGLADAFVADAFVLEIRLHERMMFRGAKDAPGVSPQEQIRLTELAARSRLRLA